jgi:hypothetical protein
MGPVVLRSPNSARWACKSPNLQNTADGWVRRKWTFGKWGQPCEHAGFAMAAVQVDETRWPLVTIKFPATLRDEDMATYLGSLKRFRERREPYALVVDTSGAAPLTARQRRMQAESITEGNPIARNYLRGIAFVVDSQIRRGVLTAIFWLTCPDWRHEIFFERDHAIVWAQSALASQSTSIRPSAIDVA